MGTERVYTLNLSDSRIQYLCERDKRLAKVIKMIGPISYTIRESEDAYPFLIHEIIEQMLSVKAGNAIYNRLKALCSGNICLLQKQLLQENWTLMNLMIWMMRQP